MKVKFGKFTNNITPNVLSPSVEDIFAQNIDYLKKYVRPILTIDLSEVNNDWQGKAHFFYAHAEDPLEFDLINKGKYSFRRSYRFEYSDVGDKLEASVDKASVKTELEGLFQEDEEYGNDFDKIKMSHKEPYLELVTVDIPDIPVRSDYKEGDEWQKEYSKWSDKRKEIIAEIAKVDPDLLCMTEPQKSYYTRTKELPIFRLDRLWIGASPMWLQSESVPLNPDKEEMDFVGQISADFFSEDMFAYMIYLFYCPKHQIVTQLVQHT
jgi:hypothetical protein